MPARSRSQNGARAPRRENLSAQRAQTNLKLANHGDGERRPQSIGPLAECTCPRLADDSFVTNGNQSQYVDSRQRRRRRRRTRSQRTRTTTVRDSRVEGPTDTTTTTTTTTTKTKTNLQMRRTESGGQPFGNILLPLVVALAVTLLLLTLFSVQTFAHAAVGADEQRTQRASVVGHPQQQVDARLILQAGKSGDGAAPKTEEEDEEEKVQWATNERRATLVKRSNVDQLSSAELPAEFRGDGQPKEQSRLARLCEQTSSVLASVLPAPFGGHKRSILCQFFGQVQVAAAAGGPSTGKQRLPMRPQTPQPAASQAQYPIPGVSSQAELQFPVGTGGYEPGQESIAILHQSQQPPVAMVATGRHPIQMVLEHQQRQLQAAAANRPVTTGWTQTRQQSQDLNVEASIQDRRVALQEFAHLAPPQKQIKFSAPLATSPAIASSSPIASSPQMSSSGWRISNGTSGSHWDTSAAAPSSSTTPMPSVGHTSQAPAGEAPPAGPPRTGAVQLSIGKRTSETPQKASTPTVRVQPSTSTNNKPTEVAGNDRVRTIEVSAQEVAAEHSVVRQKQDSGASVPKPSDARQVQRREELVIASINNLTRIEFGNQLRDTVKVINKLIDQQASVFSQQPHQSGELTAATSNQQDPMLTSESVSKSQAVPMIIFHQPPSDKTQDSLAKANSSRKSDKDEHGKVTLTSPKLNSGNLNSAKNSSGSASTARDNNLDTTGRSQRQQVVVATDQLKLGQKTGNNINNKPSEGSGDGGGEQLTTRQERISSSTLTNKLRSTTKTTTTTTAASKLATTPASGSKMATSVGQKSASAGDKKVTPSLKKQQLVAAMAADTRTSSPPKSAKESGHKRATNHSRRTTGKFSQASSTPAPQPTRNKDRKQQQNQNTTASVELRRLTTIGRALMMQNDRTTAKQARAIEGARKSQSELDLAVAQTINELSRPPVTSTWLPSRGPVGSSTTPKLGSSTTLVMRKLHKIKDNSQGRELESRFAPASWTTTSLATAPSSWSQAQSSTVTQFPWLLPDKSALASSETGDLWPAPSSVVPSTEVRTVKSVDAHQQVGAASTRRMVTPYDSEQFNLAFTAGSSKHSPLVLNRIETTRPDSLTTLKMALTRAKTTSAPQPPVTETTTTTPTRSTRLPFSAGTTQSRWLPSTAFLTRQPAATTTPTPAPTTIVSSSSPVVSPSASASSTIEIIANSYGAPSTVAAVSELDEARASETISKYTTHLSDAANELISTATRRGHFQQPLPQIANTGDYFNAETIASWPEKYHTMVSQAMFASAGASQPAKTTASFETTRRNGETYETPPVDSSAPPLVATTLLRHRIDTGTSQSASDTTRPADLLVGVVSSNAPGITILPANHKLMASSAPNENDESGPIQELRLATQPMDTNPGESTVAPKLLQTKQPLPPYTLLESAVPVGNSSTQEISQTTAADTTVATNSTSGVGGDPMRPPYRANYDFNFQQLSDPTLVLDANQSRPYVARKLYELLTPGESLGQTSSFAGAAHPARSQRFNWSALKYLAQNLLMATHGRHNETNAPKNFTADDYEDDEGANDAEQRQQVAGKTDQRRLYDLMTRSSLPPLNDYYELAAGNDSAAFQLLEPANQLHQNNSYQGKGIFERASNLLSEMKQLEQKRAAALMAAFRYQVPGPLVKPWDPIAQAAHHSSASISKFFSDRLDTSANAGSGQASGSLSPGQLLAALKSALFKQKLVARDELEARLNSGRRVDQIAPERRADDHTPNSTNNDKLELAPHENSTISLEDLEYILDANETAIGQDASAMLPDTGGNSTTLLKTMLARLFNGGNSSELATNSSGPPERDFHLIDLSANADGKQSQTAETGRPKYIRLLDYQTALTRKPLDDKARRMFAPTSGNTRQAMAEVMARLRAPAKGAVAAATEPSIEFVRGQAAAVASESDQDKPATDSFDCEGRSAGFYPDAGSLCQSFYHCSNTGHLLTFNCPTSTRFDEKSLKCGPWYEVSCDIGRVRTRRF